MHARLLTAERQLRDSYKHEKSKDLRQVYRRGMKLTRGSRASSGEELPGTRSVNDCEIVYG
jgi:hypothetical protein